ncbi:MAG: NAD(P)H-dependent oxidoreductase [Polyangiales bacterium]
MKRVLILFAHPALEKSRVHRRLVASAKRVSGVTVHDLYQVYPDFDIDVAREQALLTEHDIVVMQHPIYWYSTPALLKQWQDLVLEHGWAYGTGGNALRGKFLFSAVSAGGGEQAYSDVGLNGRTVRTFLAPIEQTARLCGVRYAPPFLVHGTHRLSDTEIDAEAARYAGTLEAVANGTLDLERVLHDDELPRNLPAPSNGTPEARDAR